VGSTFKKLEEWGTTDDFKPVPVRRELQSLAEFFEPDFLTENPTFGMDKTLNATFIKEVFNRVLKQYCTLIAGLDETLCNQKLTGCGVNSKCPIVYSVYGQQCECNAPDNCEETKITEVPSVCINDPQTSAARAQTTKAPATTTVAAATTKSPESGEGYRCCHEEIPNANVQTNATFFYKVNQSDNLCDKSAATPPPLSPDDYCRPGKWFVGEASNLTSLLDEGSTWLQDVFNTPDWPSAIWNGMWAVRNCHEVCKGKGMVCSDEELKKRNAEGDTGKELEALIKKHFGGAIKPRTCADGEKFADWFKTQFLNNSANFIEGPGTSDYDGIQPERLVTDNLYAMMPFVQSDWRDNRIMKGVMGTGRINIPEEILSKLESTCVSAPDLTAYPDVASCEGGSLWDVMHLLGWPGMAEGLNGRGHLVQPNEQNPQWKPEKEPEWSKQRTDLLLETALLTYVWEKAAKIRRLCYCVPEFS